MAINNRVIMMVRMVGFQPEFCQNRLQQQELEITPKPTLDEQHLEYLSQAICERMEFKIKK
ncbi:hypothetical protein PBF_23253 [Cytobacillus firmus DS1]|uniref:Uncharacterized protein n=1 Tax=Cytobacillus firmus DS1 TaxID=1307436 RepID=W7KR65_CYTFI|nr:hypothetical protein PBF_23253 [Cytobacillus firmus DS1]